MPRRQGPQAEATAQSERYARWRYLLRHPEFQREFWDVLRLHHTAEREQGDFLEAKIKLGQLEAKWKLPSIPQEVLLPRMHATSRRKPVPDFPELNAENVAFYEQLFVEDGPPLSQPVVAYGSDDDAQFFADLNDGLGKLTLEINLNYPIDL